MVGAVLALAAASASAQSFEDILRGVATDALRGVLKNAPAPAEPARESLPADPAPMVIGNTISADQALAVIREAGFRTGLGFSIHESPFEGYWMYGTTSENIDPVLISKDGRWVVEITSSVMERLPRGQSRELSASERQAFLRDVLKTLKPGSVIAMDPTRPDSPIVVSAANCPACIRLDMMARKVNSPAMRLVPASLGGNSGEVYSRIMCDASPRQAFERAIDSRARVLPAPVRLSQLAISELLWEIARPGSKQRSYPTLFTADGQIRPLQFDSPAALRQSLTQAGF